MRTPVAVPQRYHEPVPDLAALDDDALWALAAPRARFSPFGWLSGLTALSAFAGWPLVWSQLLKMIGGTGGLFAGLVGLLVAAFAFGRVAVASQRAREAPTMAPRRLLRQRYCQPPFAEEIAAGRARCDEGAAQVIAIVRAHARPHGDVITARAELDADGTARASRVQGRPLIFVGERPPRGEHHQPTVAVPEGAALARLLAVVTSLGAGPAHVTDGMEVEIAIVRRGAEPLVGRCNLAGLPEEAKRHPTVRVAELVLRLSAPPLPGL